MCDIKHLFKHSSVNLAGWWNKRTAFLTQLLLIIENKVGQKYINNSWSRESFRFYDMATLIYLQRDRAQIIKNTFMTERKGEEGSKGRWKPDAAVAMCVFVYSANC